MSLLARSSGLVTSLLLPGSRTGSNISINLLLDACSSSSSASSSSGRRLFATHSEIAAARMSGVEEEAPVNTMRDLVRDRRMYFLVGGLAGAAGWCYNILGGPKVTERAYLDISVGGEPAGRLVIGLHGRQANQTVRNFIGLATHDRGYGYRGAPFHQVARGFAVIGGDITKGDGSGGASIFGPHFFAESHHVKHGRGTVSMVASEEGVVRSQFMIITQAAPVLNGKHVGFGTVLEGMEIVDRIAALPLDKNTQRPLQPVVISGCGIMPKDAGTAPVAVVAVPAHDDLPGFEQQQPATAATDNNSRLQ